MIVSNKAQLPNHAHKLKRDFKLSEDDLKLVYSLPHTVALEPYVKAFQYQVLNSILYIEQEPETLHHFFFNCPHSSLFWKDCEQYVFAITKQNKVLNLQDIIVGIIDSSSRPLPNYLILIGKLYLWDYRRKHLLPCIEGFKLNSRSNTKQKNTFILRIITYLHFIRSGRRIFPF